MIIQLVLIQQTKDREGEWVVEALLFLLPKDNAESFLLIQGYEIISEKSKKLL